MGHQVRGPVDYVFPVGRYYWDAEKTAGSVERENRQHVECVVFAAGRVHYIPFFVKQVIGGPENELLKAQMSLVQDKLLAFHERLARMGEKGLNLLRKYLDDWADMIPEAKTEIAKRGAV